MEINDSLIGSIFKIEDVSENTPCVNCDSCLRLRIMEMGIYKGEKIKLVNHRFGLWTINILNQNNNVVSTIALRDEQIKRIILEDGYHLHL
jgi:Fe2+ transport system protein FeoA